MNKLLQALMLAVGSFGLFSGAFVGFAHLRGTPAHDLPLIGGMFTAPPEPAESDPVATPQDTSEDAPQPSEPPSQAGLGLLDVFRIDSPVQATELESLAQELKRNKTRVDERATELDQREEHLDERAQLLDDQFASLAELRTGLEQWQRELEERQAEVQHDESVRSEREAESWAKMAKLFEKGDAAGLAQRLGSWTPAEAARMLVHLKPDRARELLEALKGESWKDYWEAYRQAALPKAP